MQQQKTSNKIFYIDNLRVLLTALVILHHTCITYGGPGGWYFTDATSNTTALIFMTMFIATNQAFFMGFFFFLAAFFSDISYQKKGALKFVTDRLKRLGIPLLFYSFILSPCMNFLVYKFGNSGKATFMQYVSGYDDWIDFGVLWFVAALLLFTLIYVVIRSNTNKQTFKQHTLPRNNYILLFAFAIGIISYVVRIFFPVGWVLHPVGFQPGHFTQYIALFILGIIAYRNQWLKDITERNAWPWIRLVIILVLIAFPSMYGIKTATNSSLDTFQGNGSWQSFISATWEQLTGFSIIIMLLIVAHKKWNYTTSFLQQLSRGAFATYIFHPLFIISITLLLKSWQVDPAIKFLIAAPLAVIISFCFGVMISKLPVVKHIV